MPDRSGGTPDDLDRDDRAPGVGAAAGDPTATAADRALAERARAGDRSAYADLVRGCQDVAVRLAAVLGGDPSAADDIAQEAFVKAYLQLHRFRGDGSFRSWALAIVANEARNHGRSRGRRGRYELAVAEDRGIGSVAGPPGSGPGGSGGTDPVADAAATADDRSALLAAVAALPDRQRDVVACRYLLELSVAETAAVLELRTGTVKSHLSRALDRLRSDLADG